MAVYFHFDRHCVANTEATCDGTENEMDIKRIERDKSFVNPG